MVSAHPLAIDEPNVLRDRDLAEIQGLRSCYDSGGSPAFYAALDELCARDLACYIRLMRAILPDQIRRALRDEGPDRVSFGELAELLQRFQAGHGGTSVQ
jgi:hypothetical protein